MGARRADLSPSHLFNDCWSAARQIPHRPSAINVRVAIASNDVVEYLDGGALKVFRGAVTMTPDDKSRPVVRPVMTHFFCMDEKDPSKVCRWFGSVGPIEF